MTKAEKKAYLAQFLDDIQVGCDLLIDNGSDEKISPGGNPIATFAVVVQEYVLMMEEAQNGGKKRFKREVKKEAPAKLNAPEEVQKQWESVVQESPEGEPVKRTMH